MPIAAGRLVRNELGKTAVRLDQLETQNCISSLRKDHT